MSNHNQPIQVSIIVPCYNYGQFLNECLDSLLHQSFKNWECIIVDNGSTDNTKEISTNYTSKDTRFVYKYTEQRGVSYARNLAVKSSRGRYILPLDADDKIASTLLEKAFNVLEKNQNIKVVYSDAYLFGASSGPWILPAFNLKDMLIENSIFCTAMFKKSDFLAAGGYNEEMKEGFEDWDFWISMLKSGGEVYKIPEVLFYYRIRENSRNNSLDKEKQLKLRKQIYNNHIDTYNKMFSVSELIYENYSQKQLLKQIRSAPENKLGSIILKPMRFLKNMISK